MILAGPPYRTDEQWHGPCYVLDPEDFEHGWREVIAVLPPIPRRVVRPAQYAAPRPVVAQATRRGVVWPEGRPLEWRFAQIAVPRRETGWRRRAKALRARGLSVRAIMQLMGLTSYRKVRAAVS